MLVLIFFCEELYGGMLMRQKKQTPLSAILALFILVIVLPACDSPGTQNTGNGTPAVVIPTVAAKELGASYAYISNNQLWVAARGASARQITHFDESTTPDVFWHTPTWSADERHLAAIVDAQPAGEGGGGCP